MSNSTSCLTKCNNYIAFSLCSCTQPLPTPLDFYPGPVYAVDADENVTNVESIYYTLYGG